MWMTLSVDQQISSNSLRFGDQFESSNMKYETKDKTEVI